MDKAITFRDLIEKAVEFVRAYWHAKWWILFITITTVSAMLYFSSKKQVRYTASLTYTLNDGKSAPGALTGILGSFGIGGGSKVNLEKLVRLSMSRNLVQKMLFTRVHLDTFGGREDFIANHLIRLHEYNKKWGKDFIGRDSLLFQHDSIDLFDRDDLKLLKNLIGEVVGGKNNPNPVCSSAFDANTGILTLQAHTVDEQLSVEMCHSLYNYLKEFYSITNQQSQTSTVEYARVKSDSVYQQLKSKEYALSRFNDSHRNLIDMEVMTERRLLESDILKLKTLYAEVTKNRELAEFSLNAGQTEMIVIDEPIMPLDSDFQPLWLALLKGVLIGVAVSLLFFTFKKMIKDALAAA
jgi:hypothetical protein